MSLASFAIEKRTVTWFATFLVTVAGIATYFQLGKLEDPEFSVKTVAVTTSYPGAGPKEVELEVTDRIELAIQQMPQLKQVYSLSRAGQSIVKVDIKDEYVSSQLPQIWDELRKKIRDIRGQLPPGAATPIVSDDFGDVYGFLLAVTGDGYSYAELEDYVKDYLRKELSLVKGVARVELWGVQPKCIYLDVSQTKLSQLGLTPETVMATLSRQNMVVDAGQVDVQTQRLRIAPTGEFKSPQDIEDLTFRPTIIDALSSKAGTIRPGELIRLRDIATVRRGYVEPPMSMMRFNSQPSLAIYISNAAGVNIIDLGKALDKRLEALVAELPVGIEVHRIAWQADLVSESIAAFMINLIEAVAIVLVVLWVSMGLRMAVIIGLGGLLLTIIGTFLVMGIWSIDLQRMSLGALIIAMGMMVDNAIVVADGIAVRLQKGMDRTKAALEAATQPSWPLLGATFVAVMAFYPVYASPMSTGEYCMSLFQVVGISLVLSWVLAVTVVPLMCIAMLPAPKASGEGRDQDLYGGRFFQVFRGLLGGAIRLRWPFLGVMVGLLVASGLGFGYVNQMFFPDSTRRQLMIDYWAPEGTRIQQISADLRQIEAKLANHASVKDVSAFIGQGPPRFYLPVEPELPYQSYAQLIVNTPTSQDVDQLIAEMEPWLKGNFPQALTRVRKYANGPSDTWPIEARFSGPAEADAKVLRSISEQAVAILEASPLAKEVRTNWRQRVKKVVPVYAQERGRWTGVSRGNLANATKRAFDGRVVGQFRDGDDLLPIIARHVEQERQDVGNLDVLQVAPSMSTETVPLSQVTEAVTVESEDPIIWRWDRRRAITVQCSPKDCSASALRNSVLAQFEAIQLPPGYTLVWDGEYDSSKTSQEGLVPGILPAVVIILFIIVALFNAFRPPLIILCVIPFAAIGITSGLLITRAAFGFMALLGAMSLAGMMIKNAIVLLDQINLEQAAGKSPYDAVMDSAVSRLRPVINAAATTIFGMAPLLQDVFWVSMAVAIMFGLAFGTVLTMVVVPVLYVCFFRIESPQAQA